MAKNGNKEGLGKITRRAFLLRGAGAGAGVAAGEGLFRGLGWLSAGSLRQLERTVNEFVLDIRSLSGELEDRTARVRRELEAEFSHHAEQLARYGLPQLIDHDSVEELLANLDYIEQKYTLAERFHQFRTRLHRRLLRIDTFLERLQPGPLKQFDDLIRGLHGKPTGEEYRQKRQLLMEKLELLSRAYTAAEDTRRAELELSREISSLFQELNTILEDPDLQGLEDEFSQLVRDELAPPGELSGQDLSPEEIQQLPEVSEAELKRMRLLVQQLMKEAQTLNAVLKRSNSLQQLLAEGELLTQSLAGLGDDHVETGRRDLLIARLQRLEADVLAEVERLRQEGIDVTVRKTELEDTRVSDAATSLFAGTLSGPLRWSAWLLGGIAGYIIGARVSRRKRRKVKRNQEER
jgi:hypothetical protein